LHGNLQFDEKKREEGFPALKADEAGREGRIVFLDCG
jgi:hypothetical protein